MITVYYDGKCGLCRREIDHYISIASAETFEWVDITIKAERFIAQGFDVKDGLKALHVQDDSKNMHIGIGGFIVIWQNLPRWWILAKLINLPIIRHVAKFAYSIFANWRFKKLGYDSCDIEKNK